jgi:hypothetical protein
VLGHIGINVPDLEVARRYPPPYYATFWLDPFGMMLEAVCHHPDEVRSAG